MADAKTAAARQLAVYEAIRADKGRRVLAGMLQAGAMGHVMIVDDDDFVSCRLAGFVAANLAETGWYLKHGYVWTEGSRLLFRHDDFSHLCGTSHIIRLICMSCRRTPRRRRRR